VSVDQTSQIEFNLEGNRPSESQFDSLSVTAYTKDGRPVGVLDALSPDSTETITHSYTLTTCNPENNIFSYQQQHGLILKIAPQ
jgi:hypothetical protein